MNRALARRLAKLEAKAPDPTIPIYVEDEADVGRRIDELIAAGELFEEDRPHCVHWMKHERRRPMRHEDWVIAFEELEKDKKRCQAREGRTATEGGGCAPTQASEETDGA